jgi:hypothetical protein
MPDLHGYVKGGNLVVRLSFSYIDLPKRHEAFIERKAQLKEEQAQRAAAASDGETTTRTMPPPIPPQREQTPKQSPKARAVNDDELPFLE